MIRMVGIAKFGDERPNRPLGTVAGSCFVPTLAPGTDLRWHISPLIERRIPDYRDLCKLDTARILFPRAKLFFPRLDALAWRQERLAG